MMIYNKLIITPTLVAIMTVGLIANAIPSSVFAQSTGDNGVSGGNADFNTNSAIIKGENGSPSSISHGGSIPCDSR